MGVKLAAVCLLVGIVGVSVGVALFDVRAGVVTLFALIGGVGLWTLLSQE